MPVDLTHLTDTESTDDRLALADDDSLPKPSVMGAVARPVLNATADRLRTKIDTLTKQVEQRDAEIKRLKIVEHTLRSVIDDIR